MAARSTGRLICTYSDFVQWGIRRASIALAIRQAAALGFLEVTEPGGRSICRFQDALRISQLTYVHGTQRSSSPDGRVEEVLDGATCQGCPRQGSQEKRYDTQPMPNCVEPGKMWTGNAPKPTP